MKKPLLQKLKYDTAIKPYYHQREHYNHHRDKRFWAYLWDMGTGKTKMFIDIAVYLYLKNEIDCLLIIAPNDVHSDHVNIALPEHIFPELEHIDFIYDASKFQTKKFQREIAHVINNHEKKLKVGAFNTDALRTKNGYNTIKKFLTTFNCYMVIDEYTDFNNPKSKRSKYLMSLINYPKYKGIFDGTPIHKSPLDLWIGFNFLRFGCLGYTSFTAFKSRYSTVENWKLRNEIYAIIKQSKIYYHYPKNEENVPILPHDENLKIANYAGSIYSLAKQYQVKDKKLQEILPDNMWDIIGRLTAICGRVHFYPTEYKNLDELHRRIQSFSSRYLKDECLDLPPKVEVTIHYSMDEKTKKYYKELVDNFLILYNDRLMTIENTLTMYLRIQQIIGGHLKLNDNETPIEISTQRCDLLIRELKKLPENAKVLIFCRFTAEIRQVMNAIRKEFGQKTVVDYYGATTKVERATNKYRFMNDPECLYFVANRKSGGIGLDGLQVASYIYHYSKDWSSRLHNQSTDRGYRGGLKHKLTVIDFVCKGSIDVRISKILADNKNVSDQITGDPLILLQG